MTNDIVEVSVHIDAPRELVFQYFIDPALYVRWMGREAVLEPRAGGQYRVVVRPGVDAIGEFIEVDPPRRLVFTWGSEAQHLAPQSTTVEVTLTDHNGATRVMLRHHGLAAAERRVQNEYGWSTYLHRLAVVAAGGNPGPDPWAECQPGSETATSKPRWAPDPEASRRG